MTDGYLPYYQDLTYYRNHKRVRWHILSHVTRVYDRFGGASVGTWKSLCGDWGEPLSSTFESSQAPPSTGKLCKICDKVARGLDRDWSIPAVSETRT